MHIMTRASFRVWVFLNAGFLLWLVFKRNDFLDIMLYSTVEVTRAWHSAKCISLLKTVNLCSTSLFKCM